MLEGGSATIHSGGNYYFIPCCIYKFAHLQRNKQWLIFKGEYQPTKKKKTKQKIPPPPKNTNIT